MPGRSASGRTATTAAQTASPSTPAARAASVGTTRRERTPARVTHVADFTRVAGVAGGMGGVDVGVSLGLGWEAAGVIASGTVDVAGSLEFGLGTVATVQPASASTRRYAVSNAAANRRLGCVRR